MIDNLKYGFTYLEHSSPKRPHADIKKSYTITLIHLPLCNNKACVATIAQLISGISYQNKYNIAEDRIDEIKQVKDKTWLVKTTIPYKD